MAAQFPEAPRAGQPPAPQEVPSGSGRLERTAAGAASIASKARASLELLRVWNGAVAALGALLGGSLVLGRFEGSLPLLMAALGALLVTGGGNGLNDLYDLSVDRLNRPDRPIPSGRLTEREARRVSLGAFTAGSGLAFAASPAAGVVALLNAGLLALYARHSKRMLLTGNLLVAGLVASVFPYGALVTGPASVGAVLPITLCAFLAALSLEIVKDIEDVKGDAAMGARTLPLYAGTGLSRVLAVGSMVAAVALSPGPYLAGELHPAYWGFVGPADGLFVLAVLVRPGHGRKAISLGMGLVLLGLWAGLDWR